MSAYSTLLNSSRHVIGILTEIDLLRNFTLHHDRDLQGNPPLSACMTPQVTAIKTTTTLKEALDLCSEKRVRHLPVLGNAGLVGMVSDRDLLRAIGKGRRPDIAVKSIMTRELRTIDDHMRISDAAAELLQGPIGALAVTHGCEVVGMVSTLDILDHLIGSL